MHNTGIRNSLTLFLSIEVSKASAARMDALNASCTCYIARNYTLVDIQGADLLLRIFTSKFLQRTDGEESTSLGFFQRVRSTCKDATTDRPKAIKFGCGGFGIRTSLRSSCPSRPQRRRPRARCVDRQQCE